jgi:hypothetical protein
VTERPRHLTGLELATGIVSGEGPNDIGPLVNEHPTPLAALEDILAEALVKEPCFITFTGGRDSSAMLAVALRVARTRGLTVPTPLTMVFPHVRSSDETSWQELLLDYLGLDRSQWERIEIGEGELDLVGPVATEMLSRHGLLYPPNALLAIPVIKHVGAATVVTGLEGDGLLGGWRPAYFADLIARRRKLHLDELASNAYQLTIRQIRHRVIRRRALPMPWLTPRAYDQFRNAWAHEKVTAPRRWDSWVHWWANRRYLGFLTDSFGILGGEHGTRPVHPLMDPRFLGALAKAGGVTGIGDRQALMHAIFGDVLPQRVLDRRTKAATFTELVWGPQSREFSARWDGRGVDPTYVDAERLKTVWTRLEPTAVPDELTSLLLQSVWLNTSEAY